MSAKFSGRRGLCSCNRREWGHFVPRSLHRKFPFLARVSETGSTTGWGVGSSVPSVSTIQSSQTAHFVGDFKEVVSAGISPVSSPDFPSLRTSAVSRADFWPPVSASKNSVPGSWISSGKDRSAAWKSGILGGKNAVSSGGRKLLRIKSKRFELSSILPEHRAVVQLQPRQATFDRIL